MTAFTALADVRAGASKTKFKIFGRKTISLNCIPKSSIPYYCFINVFITTPVAIRLKQEKEEIVEMFYIDTNERKFILSSLDSMTI